MSTNEEGSRYIGGMSIPAWIRRPGSSSLLLFLVLSVFYLLLLQKHPYGDGITYLDFLMDGKLAFHHLLYLPTLWLFSQLTAPLGVSTRTAAFAWSALSAAGAVSLLYYLLRTARSFRIEVTRPLLLVLIVATAPSVLFFATQLENHANHLLWVTFFFLVLDRALASLSPVPWILAGLALTGAYASHSSILLLFPTILLLVHYFWNGRFLRMPVSPEILRLLLLFVPTLGFKYLVEPWIKGLQGDPNLALDFGQKFALSLMQRQSASWLWSYLVDEVFLAAFGLWGLFVVFQSGRQDRRAPAGCLLLGLLTYYLFFAHWPVREHGAYFLPLLPFAALVIGRPQAWLARIAAPVFIVLILAQGAVGYRAMQRFDRADGPWVTAQAIADIVPDETIVLCRSGVVQLHLKHDQNLEAQALENWMIGWTHSATQIPNFWDLLIQREILPKLDKILETHALYMTRAASDVLRADPGAKKILEAMQQHYRFDPLGQGANAGWRLYPR